MLALNFYQTPWDPSKDYSSEEKTLQTGYQVQSVSMREYLGSLEKTARFRGDVSVKVIQSWEKGEASQAPVLLAAFKAGSKKSAGIYFEEFASRIDTLFWKSVGKHYIPPTVARTFPSREEEGAVFGSASFYVPNELDLWNDASRSIALKSIGPVDRANMAALAWFFLQWDLHPGNWLCAEDEEGARHGVLIDLEGGVQYGEGPYGERPFVAIDSTDDKRAQGEHNLEFGQNDPMQTYNARFSEFGFNLPLKQLENLSQLMSQREDRYRLFKVKNGRLLNQFHGGNEGAFPIFTPKIPESTRDFFKGVDLDMLQEAGSNLIECDPRRFDPRKSDFFPRMLARRDEMLDKTGVLESDSFCPIL